MISYTITTEHLNFSTPQFSIGEWLGDGLILGIRWDPQLGQWSYLCEAPEIEGMRWIPEDHLERTP